MVTGKAIRLIISGVVVIGLGCFLYTLPKEMDLAWYHPLPAFAAGLLLIALGVHSLRAMNEPDSLPPISHPGSEARMEKGAGRSSVQE
jgi:hypothetical protein